jgi:hypothetical protein
LRWHCISVRAAAPRSADAVYQTLIAHSVAAMLVSSAFTVVTTVVVVLYHGGVLPSVRVVALAILVSASDAAHGPARVSRTVAVAVACECCDSAREWRRCCSSGQLPSPRLEIVSIVVQAAAVDHTAVHD